MAKEEDESLLILLVQQGDVAAFEKLLRRLYQPLRYYVTGMVGVSLRDDVLQETSLRIYRQIKFLREPKAFQSWVYRIATRVAFAHLKREKQWRRFDTGPELLDSLADTNAPQEELESELLGMVDRLSPASRAVLLLHYQQQLSLEETAAILDIPLGTAKSRLSYGITTLRNLIQEKESK